MKKILPILSAVIVIIIAVLFIQNRDVSDDFSETHHPNTEKTDPTTNNIEREPFDQKLLADISWTPFDNDAYDFTFRYPADFGLVEERTRSTYADGTEWQYLLFKSPLRDNEARFSISINPDGIGIPYDKSFSVHETPQGKVLSLDIECTDDPNCTDDGTMLFLARHWEEKGNVYQIILAYEELEGNNDTTNYETMLKEIVGSFRAY